MRCPIDETELVDSELNGLRIKICSSCKGFLVSLHQPQAQALKKLIAKNFESSLEPATSWTLKSPYSDSPHSKPLMKRFDLFGVSLDFCEQGNGVWFDYGEIERIESKIRKIQETDEMPDILNSSYADLSDDLEEDSTFALWALSETFGASVGIIGSLGIGL